MAGLDEVKEGKRKSTHSVTSRIKNDLLDFINGKKIKEQQKVNQIEATAEC